MLELVGLCALRAASCDGHDISRAATKFADDTLEDLNRTLGMDAGPDGAHGKGAGIKGAEDGPIPLYARWVAPPSRCFLRISRCSLFWLCNRWHHGVAVVMTTGPWTRQARLRRYEKSCC